MTSPHKQSFKLHQNAIFAFLQSQSGSFGRALSELVMNSCDAFATEVHIQLRSDGYTVADNGRGFVSRAEIAAWFATLGWPHDEGSHRQYGKHGQGRAAQWSYASTLWHTNQFFMDVDVKANGLDFEVREGDKREGTLITGKFYKPLDTNDMQTVLTEVEQLCRFVAIPVFVNGKLISRDPATVKWDLETPQAYIMLKGDFVPKHRRSVYNIGVHVADVWSKHSALVVTKPGMALELGLGRNALSPNCPVWAAVAKTLQELEAKQKDPKPPKKEKRDLKSQQANAQEVLSGTMALRCALTQHPDLIIGVNGRRLTRDAFFKCAPWVFVKKSDPDGKALQATGLAYVLDREHFESIWGVDGLEKLRARVEADKEYTKLVAHAWTTDPAPYLPDESERFTPVKPSALTELEAIAAKSLYVGTRTAILALRKTLDEKDLSSRVRLVDWHDRKVGVVQGDILLDRKAAVLAFNNGYGRVQALVNLLFKTLFDKFLPGAEASAAFLEYITTSSEPGLAAARVMGLFLSKATAAGIKLPASALRSGVDEMVQPCEDPSGSPDLPEPLAPVVTAAAPAHAPMSAMALF